MLNILAVSGYRSLRDLVIPLDRLNLVTGAERQRQVEPVSRAAAARRHRAGPRHPVARARGRPAVDAVGRAGAVLARACCAASSRCRAASAGIRSACASGFAADDFSYAIDLGLPPPPVGAFGHDPEIKRECVWSGQALRPSTMLVDRRGPLVKSRDGDGDWTIVTQQLASFDSMMTHCADPRHTPELLMLREEMRAWRFYDHFRTDAAAPARLPQIGTHTPVLESRRRGSRGRAPDDPRDRRWRRRSTARSKMRSPGGRVAVSATTAAGSTSSMQQHGLLRPLQGRRALRRHAALSALDRRAADAAAARPAGAQRAGNQPAP